MDGKHTHIALKQVLYVTALMQNLFSAAKCRENGYRLIIDEDAGGRRSIEVIQKSSGDTKMTAFEAPSGLYEIIWSPVKPVQAGFVTHSVSQDIWPKCLARHGSKTIKKSPEMVHGLNTISSSRLRTANHAQSGSHAEKIGH